MALLRNHLFCLSLDSAKRLSVLFVLLQLTIPSYSQQFDSCSIAWTIPVPLSFDTSGTGPPGILLNGDSVFVLWGSQFPGNSAVWYSTSGNLGETWTNPVMLIPSSIDNLWGEVHVAGSANWIYVVWNGCNPCLPDPNAQNEIRLLRSSNFGSTWLPVQVLGRSYGGPTATFGNELFINVKDSSFSSRILRSHDNGETFALLPGVPDQLGTYQFEGFVASSSGLHGMLSFFHQPTGSFETYYYRSTDAGLTWEDPQILSAIDDYNTNVWDLAASGPEKVYALWNDGKYGGVFSGTLLIRRSDDGGQTFGSEQILSSNTAVTYALATDANRFFVAWDKDEGGSDNGSHVSVVQSLDEGITFCQQSPVGESVHNTMAPDIAVGNSIVLAGSWRDSGSYEYQVFFTRGDIMTRVAEDEESSDPQFSLSEPYPNPFNPSTTINYAIPTSAHVTLKVFDVVGREVLSAVDEFVAAGQHIATIMGDGLASGVYLYRLNAGSYTATKKLVLLK